MNRLCCIVIVLSVTTLCSVASGEDNPANDKLLHDPFKKPEKYLPVIQHPVTGGHKDENLFQTNSVLTATLRAGRNSMVIVDGKTINLGEAVNGYQLIAVKEHSAVFTNNGQQHILKIDKTDEVK
jgi:hypothetical protein